jgi:exopolysaccharide biosynthesis polyprenyl glycosylphosphotransferase
MTRDVVVTAPDLYINHVKPNRIQHLGVFYLLSDLCALTLAYWMTVRIRFSSEWGMDFFTAFNRMLGVRDTGALPDTFHVFYLESAPRILLLIALTLVPVYALLNLYAGRRFLRRRPEAVFVLAGNAIALLIFYVYFYLDRNTFHPRSFIATAMVLNAVFGSAGRSLLFHGLNLCRRRFHFDVWPALVVGHSRHADLLATMVDAFRPQGWVLAERLRWKPEQPLDALFAEMADATRRHSAAALIVAEPQLDVKSLMAVLERASNLGLATRVLSNHFGILVTRAHLPIELVEGIPLVHFEPHEPAGIGQRLRQAMSRIAATLLLAVLLPAVALIAALIRLTSPGPVFFVQERMGVNRRPFRMLKFRTMRHRAEEEQAALEEFNETATLFKIRRDPRVTPVGRFLRRFSLDELPQLINVLRGEMAIVGPRPLPRRDFEHYYEEWHYQRHAGLPGLTCLWQISGRSELDFHDMCILDVYYLANRTVVLDAQIALRTILVVIFGRGAY